MSNCARRRLATAPTVATVVVALALAGCGSDGRSTSDPVTTAADASPTRSTLASEPVDTPLYDNLDDLVESIRADIGDVQVPVMFVYSDNAVLMHVDPATPSNTIRHVYVDGAWTDRTGVPHPATGQISLAEIDPDTVRAAVRATPGVHGLDEAEVDHVGIGPDDDGELGYVVSMTSPDDRVISVTFDPDLRVLETWPPL